MSCRPVSSLPKLSERVPYWTILANGDGWVCQNRGSTKSHHEKWLKQGESSPKVERNKWKSECRVRCYAAVLYCFFKTILLQKKATSLFFKRITLNRIDRWRKSTKRNAPFMVKARSTTSWDTEWEKKENEIRVNKCLSTAAIRNTNVITAELKNFQK